MGGGDTIEVDVRVVAATHRDLEAEVEAGRFREDLYYRLHVIPLALPSLRERDDDIILISRHLLRQYNEEEHKSFDGFTEQAEAILCNYDWPGNVRQLQNVLRNIIVLNDGPLVTREMLPPLMTAGASGSELASEALASGTAPEHTAPPASANPIVQTTVRSIIPLWRVEKAAIEQAISQCDNNIPRAAALLEISPSTIYRKRQQWETMDDDTKGM